MLVTVIMTDVRVVIVIADSARQGRPRKEYAEKPGVVSMQIFYRCGIGLFLAALISGCSFMGFDEPGPSRSGGNSGYSSGYSGVCLWNPGGCIYEGAYEPGERDYAEQEARRLNQAALQRLRRSSIR